MRSVRRTFSFLILVVLIVGGCTQGPSGTDGGSAEWTGPREIRLRMGSDISSLDPKNFGGIEATMVAMHIYNGLVKYDQKSSAIVPDLAERWEMSNGGRVWTFHLRQGVKWHKNYGEFVAGDVKTHIERIKDPKTGSPQRGELASVDRVEAVDKYTVRFHLSIPYVGFLHKVAANAQGFITNARAIADFGEKYPSNPIGTGPFVFERWTPGDRVVLVANPDYFEGAPWFEKATFHVIPEETAAEIALKNGEIDVFMMPQSPAVIERLRGAGGITVSDRVVNGFTIMNLDTTREPLTDVRVRRAIAHCIDRGAMREKYFQNTKFEAHAMVAKGLPEHTMDGVTTYAYDPARGMSLLREAGAAGFTLNFNSVALQPWDEVGVLVAADLKKCGINVQFTIHERTAYGAQRAKGEFMALLTGMSGVADPLQHLDRAYHSRFVPPNGLNTAKYKNPEVDRLLEGILVEQDDTKRIAMFHELQRITSRDLPVITLYSDIQFLAWRKVVKGVVQNAFWTCYVYPLKFGN